MSTLSADLLSGPTVSLEVHIEQLDDQAVDAASLSFDAYGHTGDWGFALSLLPSGDLPFSRCG